MASNSASNSRPIVVKRGLDDMDEHFDLLGTYFTEMQKSTVEATLPADLITFAQFAHYFGVIMVEEGESLDECGDEDAEGEPEEDSEAVAFPIYPESTATSPPPSTASSFLIVGNSEGESPLDPLNKPFDVSSLSAEERIRKWQEAFEAEIEDGDGEPIVVPLQPIDVFEVGSEEPHGSSSLIADHDIHTTSNMDDNTEDFINWPDDDMAVDSIPTVYDVYESQRGKEDSDVPQQAAENQPRPKDMRAGKRAAPAQWPQIPREPEVQAMIYNAAVEYRDELRARRVVEHETKKARARQPPLYRDSPLSLTPKAKPPTPHPIGLVYLWTNQTYDDRLHVGECNLGFYIAPEYRKNRHLIDALNVPIKEAFADKQCHRLQSMVVDHEDKLFSFELLTACGFRQEGTHRRTFLSPIAYEWRDITYFAMLATEWVLDSDKTSSTRLRTASLWEEILTRHQRERDDLHRLEEKKLTRSSSLETVRQQQQQADEIQMAVDSPSAPGGGTSLSPGSSSTSPVRRKKVVLGAVAQARQKQGSSSYPGPIKFVAATMNGTSAEGPSQSQAVRARYETMPSSPKRSRGQRSTGGSSFSSSSSVSDLSSQWDLDEFR